MDGWMDGVYIIDRLGLSFCTLYEMRTLIAGVWLLPYGGPAATACEKGRGEAGCERIG